MNYEKYREWLVRNQIASKVKAGKWVNQYTVPFTPLEKTEKDGIPVIHLHPADYEQESIEMDNAIRSSGPHDCAEGDII